KRAIVEAGIDVFSVNPNAGMSEVADASGVGRTTLYRHFPTREALIQGIVLACLEEIDEATEPAESLTGVAAIEATFELLIPVADRFRFLIAVWHIASEDSAVARLQDKQRRDMVALFKEAQRAKEIHSALPAVWLCSLFEMTLSTAWELIASGDLSADEAIDCAKRSFLDGCRAR
ncbi:MAG: TetR/AcrR family transcriptional regulator, partial [Pseudomonadota bacterium]